MEISTNPAELFDAIERLNDRHPKTFGRLGVSRPIGFVVLGLAATGKMGQLSEDDAEGSVAERILTGDDIKDLPADCVVTWQKRKISTYAFIGAHVAAQLGFKPATITELGKVPGTSSGKVRDLLAELPTMEEHRKQAEAKRKAAAKRAADTGAVRVVWKFAEKFKAPHNEETYAEVMDERDLSWQQVSDMVAAFTRESDAATKAKADADADAAKADA